MNCDFGFVIFIRKGDSVLLRCFLNVFLVKMGFYIDVNLLVYYFVKIFFFFINEVKVSVRKFIMYVNGFYI